MRKLVVFATSIAIALSTISPATSFAQTVAARSAPAAAEVDPLVVATIQAFPSGGQALTDRIRTLVLQNNDLAKDVARYLISREVSAPQREAVEKGLIEALNRLGINAQYSNNGNDGLLAFLVTAGIAGLAAGLGASNVGGTKSQTLVGPVTPH